MTIDFDKTDLVEIPHFYGGEGSVRARMYADGLNRIMRGSILPGNSIGVHTHDVSSEIVFVVSGTARVIYDGAEELVPAGQCHYCPQGHSHGMTAAGAEELIILAVVPQHGGKA